MASGKLKLLLTAFALTAALAAKVLLFSNSPQITTELKKMEKAAQVYQKSATQANEQKLVQGIAGAAAAIKENEANAPPEDRGEIDKKLVEVQEIVQTSAQIKSINIPPEVDVAVEDAASQMARGKYDLKKPLYAVIGGKTVILMTGGELGQIDFKTQSAPDRQSLIRRWITIEIASKVSSGQIKF